MNCSEVTQLVDTFYKEEVRKRKKEAQGFYNIMLAICTTACFVGYLGLVHTATQYQTISDILNSDRSLLIFCLPIYLGASLYYLMTLLHDYVHATSYYSPTARFVIEYIVPILMPMNPAGYRWGHFQHHSNTNRFSEEFDTLPPVILEKNLTAFCLNCLVHSVAVLAIFVVRILINPLMMLSKKTRLIYFNYVSSLGKISPRAYPIRNNSKEFNKNFIGNLISLSALTLFWAMSGFSMVFVALYLVSLAIASAWVAFRSLVDHACIDVIGKEEVTKANFYYTSNFDNAHFWYAGFATHHLIHHINPSIPHYFCEELNDLICEKVPEYQNLHQRRNSLPLVIKDFYGAEATESELLKTV